MSTTTMNIRMDSDLKRQFDAVAQAIGLTSAAAFNVFARQFVSHRGFPFAVSAPVAPAPTEREFAEQMDEAYASMRAGAASEHELLEA